MAMTRGLFCTFMLACASLVLGAQEPTILDAPGIRQAMATERDKSSPTDATPKAGENAKPSPREGDAELQLKKDERQRQAQEIKALKLKEGGPRRFGQDLFESREDMLDTAEGGIGEDYVLGVGDQMLVAGFGSATFEVPALVNGRGDVLIPKVGSVAVAGLSLGRAKAAIQGKVNRVLAGTSVDLAVTKLRQVRIFVLGEVYKPGGFLVPSLSSLVNVLGLAGGPTALGSFRQIRVMRGGKVLHEVDLYPLRAEGKGNLNVSLQSGDTIFVPLIVNPVLLEGSFLRLAGRDAEKHSGLDRVIDPRLERRARDGRRALDPGLDRANESSLGIQTREDRKALDPGLDRAADLNLENPVREGRKALDASPGQTGLSLQRDRLAKPNDQAGPEDDTEGRPQEARSEDARSEDALPSMQFELLPGETAQDALRFAGRLLPNAYADGLTLRRQNPNGVTTVLDLAMDQLGGCELLAGDVLSALPRRDRLEALVYVVGWARVPGTFARTEGLRVGDLLKRQAQVMPDTYLYRGDIVRTLSDGSTRFLSFDVAKAMAGEPAHNLLLENRDRVRLHRINRMRLPKHVILSGPFTLAGVYEFHEGMRVADLVFNAGIPQKKANRMEAELARSRDGRPSEVRKVDLARLISTETGSPVDLVDEAVNPLLQEDDQITVYEKPEFRVHRRVRVSGQVAKPGIYVLDLERPTLSQLIQRAGGLTAEAMPKAGILLRSFESGTDPNVKGINDIMGRLNETKLLLEKTPNSTEYSKGALFRPPVLHGIGETKLNRIVVDFEGALKGNKDVDTEVLDGDEIIIPRVMDTANVVGETSSPFGSYKVRAGMKASDLLSLAGGTTRNADTSNIRLVKADGRILDSWVKGRPVEPGDTLIVPQRFRRESNWQENLTALTSVGLILNALAASGHL